MNIKINQQLNNIEKRLEILEKDLEMRQTEASKWPQNKEELDLLFEIFAKNH